MNIFLAVNQMMLTPLLEYFSVLYQMAESCMAVCFT